MKKILLSSAALVGLAFVAAPAAASEPALQLGVSGYAAAYGVYTHIDGLDDYRKFDFRKHSEVYLSGEVALDNGITAGAHFEILADRSDENYGDSRVQESYIYLASNWGRINFGEEDGAAYLLQVAAPSADSNIDGLRPIISTMGEVTIGYAQDMSGYTNKFTYITPVFNGFQAGVSYIPHFNSWFMMPDDLSGLAPAVTKAAARYENGVELAARYEGSFDAVDVTLGAGYGTAANTVANPDNKRIKEYNIAAKLGFDNIGVGAVYTHTNSGFRDSDIRQWVLGADYTVGAYKLGASYQDSKFEGFNNNPDEKIKQWTVGGVYEWGPGMTFRGAVQYIDNGLYGENNDDYQVMLGTQLNF